MNLLNVFLLLALAILLNGAAAIDIQVFGHVINVDDPINIAVAISAQALAAYAFRHFNNRLPAERESTPYGMMSSDIIDSVFTIDRGTVEKVTLATRLTKDNVSLSVIENGNHEPSSFGDTLATHIWELGITGLCVAVLLCKVRNRMDRLQNSNINSFQAAVNNRQSYITDASCVKGAGMQIILFRKGTAGTDAGRLKQIHTNAAGIIRDTAQPSAGRSETGTVNTVGTSEYSVMLAANGSDGAKYGRDIAAPTPKSGRYGRKYANRKFKKISMAKLAVKPSNQGREVAVL